MSLFSNLIEISYNLLSELDTIRPLTRIHNWPQSEQTTSWSVIHLKKKTSWSVDEDNNYVHVNNFPLTKKKIDCIIATTNVNVAVCNTVSSSLRHEIRDHLGFINHRHQRFNTWGINKTKDAPKLSHRRKRAVRSERSMEHQRKNKSF
jgi:hypothetical protein